LAIRSAFSWSVITEGIHLLAWSADKREVFSKDPHKAGTN
jgi:hypothetical protein